MVDENAADLEVLARFVEEGKLAPVVDRHCPLARVAEAMLDLQAGRVRGKVGYPQGARNLFVVSLTFADGTPVAG